MNNSKIKIVQVYKHAYPDIGGIEADISQIFDCLPNDSFEKEILCCSNKYKSETIDNVKFTRCPYLFQFAANTISPEFILRLSQVKTDVLHYHMPFIFAVVCHYLAKPKYKKMIISYHGGIYGYDKYMKYFNKLYEKFYTEADLIHVYTENLLDTDPILEQNRHKAAIIPYAVKIDENFKIKNRNNKIKQLLCMGRLVHWKGIQNVLAAMKNVDNANLNIVGDGPYRKDLEYFIKNNHLESKVKMLGKITDQNQKEEIFKNTDIFVFPSIRKSESFGQVQIQAMQYEIPVINTNLGTGVNYISLHNETGLTVEPNNIEQLTDAINKLVQNHELRQQLGKNARNRVKELFDIEKIKDKYIKMEKFNF